MSRKISRREERARKRAGEELRNRLMIGGGAVAAALVIGFAVYSQLSRPPSPTPIPGVTTTAEQDSTSGPQFVPDEGAEHIAPGAAPPYEHTTNPPTSGWHYPQPAGSGVYEQPVPDGNLVHSLEHGYVIISYNCGSLSNEECQDLKSKLADLFNREGAFKLIVVPRPELDTVIAVTAWTWLDKFNEYDEQRISNFIDRFRDHGPEAAPS